MTPLPPFVHRNRPPAARFLCLAPTRHTPPHASPNHIPPTTSNSVPHPKQVPITQCQAPPPFLCINCTTGAQFSVSFIYYYYWSIAPIFTLSTIHKLIFALFIFYFIYTCIYYQHTIPVSYSVV